MKIGASHSIMDNRQLDGNSSLRLSETFSSHAEAWDRLLSDQVSLFSEGELTCLALSKPWQTCKRVVDIGCGNGDFLAQLASRFPSKQFMGCDTSPELVSLAQDRHRLRGLNIVLGGVAEEVSSFSPDGCVLRFVLQHLSDPKEFLAHLSVACPDVQFLFIIESDLNRSACRPRIGALEKLVARRASAAITCGLPSLRDSGWTLLSDVNLISHNVRETWPHDLMESVLLGWVRALMFGAPFERAWEAEQEIAEWISHSGEEITLGFKVWTLVRQRRSRRIKSNAEGVRDVVRMSPEGGKLSNG